MQKSKRFLPIKKVGKSSRKLTHEQVRQAVRAFQASGGLINKLPPEPAGRRSMVGKRWVSMYESIFEQT